IFGSVQDSDLGFISAEVDKLVAASKKDLPKGSQVVVRGQVQTMKQSFTALPTALAGIVWMLFLTHTTVSVPALTGAIMCMGVATANSVLVVSFARERLTELGDATAAALEAGFVRFRPVLMTALAMIIGMVPMALSVGEGGEQNAPLGRAVIGGLTFSTIATLFFVRSVFTLIHGRTAQREAA